MSEALATNEIEDEESRKAKQLPDPVGYKLLIALPEPDEKTEGGILKSTVTLHDEEIGSIVGVDLKLSLIHI